MKGIKAKLRKYITAFDVVDRHRQFGAKPDAVQFECQEPRIARTHAPFVEVVAGRGEQGRGGVAVQLALQGDRLGAGRRLPDRAVRGAGSRTRGFARRLDPGSVDLRLRSIACGFLAAAAAGGQAQSQG